MLCGEFEIGDLVVTIESPRIVYEVAYHSIARVWLRSLFSTEDSHLVINDLSKIRLANDLEVLAIAGWGE